MPPPPPGKREQGTGKGKAVSNFVLLCLEGGQNGVGKGFDNLGWWLIEKCLKFGGSTAKKFSR